MLTRKIVRSSYELAKVFRSVINYYIKEWLSAVSMRVNLSFRVQFVQGLTDLGANILNEH